MLLGLGAVADFIFFNLLNVFFFVGGEGWGAGSIASFDGAPTVCQVKSIDSKCIKYV